MFRKKSSLRKMEIDLEEKSKYFRNSKWKYGVKKNPNKQKETFHSTKYLLLRAEDVSPLVGWLVH